VTVCRAAQCTDRGQREWAAVCRAVFARCAALDCAVLGCAGLCWAVLDCAGWCFAWLRCRRPAPGQDGMADEDAAFPQFPRLAPGEPWITPAMWAHRPGAAEGCPEPPARPEEQPQAAVDLMARVTEGNRSVAVLGRFASWFVVCIEGECVLPNVHALCTCMYYVCFDSSLCFRR
jgi:hypothetical protein